MPAMTRSEPVYRRSALYQEMEDLFRQQRAAGSLWLAPFVRYAMAAGCSLSDSPRDGVRLWRRDSPTVVIDALPQSVEGQVLFCFELCNELGLDPRQFVATMSAETNPKIERPEDASP